MKSNDLASALPSIIPSFLFACLPALLPFVFLSLYHHPWVTSQRWGNAGRALSAGWNGNSPASAQASSKSKSWVGEISRGSFLFLLTSVTGPGSSKCSSRAVSCPCWSVAGADCSSPWRFQLAGFILFFCQDFKFTSQKKIPPSQYQEKKLYGAHSVYFNTPVQKADLGIRMAFNGWGGILITAWSKPCCRGSSCLFFSPSHSACCMQNQHSSPIVQEKNTSPLG